MIKIYMTGYNAEELIHDAIKSIVYQSFTDWELQVIIDPKPGSRTGEYALNYNSDKVKVLVNESRVGLMGNIKTAISMLNPSDEDIIICVDADDRLVDNEVLQKVWNTYRKNPDIAVCYGGISVDDAGVKRVPFFRAYTKHELDNVRSVGWQGTHLRTMKYKVYRNIPDSHLTNQDGEYFDISNDIAIMTAAIELAGPDRVGYFDFPTYIYRPPESISASYYLSKGSITTQSDNHVTESKLNESIIRQLPPLSRVKYFNPISFAMYVYGNQMAETVATTLKEATIHAMSNVTDFVFVELHTGKTYYSEIAKNYKYRYVSYDISGISNPNISTYGRNISVLSAKNEFVVINDADLLINKEFFYNISEMCNSHQFFGSWHTINYNNQSGTGYDKTANWITGQYTGANGGSVTVSKSLFNAVGGYDSVYNGWGAEDNDFALRAAIHMGYAPTCANNVITHLWHPSNALSPDSELRVSNNNILYDRLNKYTQYIE